MHISWRAARRRPITAVLAVVVALVATVAGVDAPRAVAAGVTTATPPGGSFVPVGPYRMFDTELWGHPPESFYSFHLQAAAGLTSGASALVLSVTVVADRSGWVRIGSGPRGGADGTSDGTFVAGEATTFQTVVTTGEGDVATDFNLSVPARLVVDLEGYVSTPETATSRFTPLTPLRIADSRSGTGLGFFGPGTVQRLRVGDQPGVPPGTTAVLVNVTIATSRTSTYVTAWDGVSARPVVSQVSAPPGGVRTARVLVPVAPDGTIALYNAAGATDLVVDLVGAVSDAPGGSYFQPADHVRILDSAVASSVSLDPTLDAGSGAGVRAPSVDDVAPTTAVLTTLTVDQPAANGFVRAFASGVASPSTSDVNTVRGRAVSNTAVVGLGADGRLRIDTSSPARIVVDLDGWFRRVPDATPASGIVSSSTAPFRYYPTPPVGYISTVPTGLPASFAVAVVNSTTEAPSATAWALGGGGSVLTSSTGGVAADGSHLDRWTAATAPAWAAQVPPLQALAGAGDTRDAAVYGVGASGVVFGWGVNPQGELGRAPFPDPTAPVAIGIPKPVVRVFAAPGVGYAGTRSGELWSWGRDDTGQLGSAAPSGTPSWQPRRVGGVSNVVLLAGTATTTVAVDRAGRMFVWGGPTTGNADVPARRFSPRGCSAVTDLDVEDRDIWARCGDGTVRAVVESGGPVAAPEAAASVTGAVQIGPGDYHGAYGPRVLLSDGTVVRVGRGVYTAPRVAGLSGVTALGGGSATPFAVVGTP